MSIIQRLQNLHRRQKIGLMRSRRGQSTVEYILLVGMVVGAVMIFIGPVGKIIASAIKTQKDKAETEYTDGEKKGYVEYYDKVTVIAK